MSKKITFFDFICFTSLILVLITIYSYAVQPLINKNVDTYYFRIAKDFLFFNTLHVPLTIFLLFTNLNMNTWLRRKKTIFRKFKYEIILAFFIFSLTAYFAAQKGVVFFKTNSQINTYYVIIFKVLFLLLTAFHGLGQNYGISSVLNKNCDENRIQKKMKNIFSRC